MIKQTTITRDRERAKIAHPVEERVFMAVRKNESHRYLDITTTSEALDRTRQLSAQDDEALTAWAKDNPVVGFADCHVVIDDVFLP